LQAYDLLHVTAKPDRIFFPRLLAAGFLIYGAIANIRQKSTHYRYLPFYGSNDAERQGD
jgi:hypothetical protein